MSLVFLLLAIGCNGGNDMPEDYCDWPVDWYPDADSDGFGDADAESRPGCDAPGLGWVSNGSDCDDSDENTWPGASEICDNQDNNCDGEIDENGDIEAWPDTDGDGYGDESAASIQTCEIPAGYADNHQDCDDSEATTNAGAEEQCDGIDNNCDGQVDESGDGATFYLDVDGDGIGVDSGTVSACDVPAGYAEYAGDCDDSDSFDPGWVDSSAASGGDGTMEAPLNSIMDALGAGHGCIVLQPGTYQESVSISNQSVSVLGLEGPDVTILEGIGGPAFHLQDASNTRIEGIRITAGEGLDQAQFSGIDEAGHAFFIAGGSVSIVNVEVVGIQAKSLTDGIDDMSGGIGLYADDSAVVDLEDVVYQNLSAAWGSVLYIHDGFVTGRRVSFLDNGIGYTMIHVVGSLELDATQFVGNQRVTTSFAGGSSWADYQMIYHYDGSTTLRNATMIDNDVDVLMSVNDARPGTDPDDNGAWFSVESSIMAFNTNAVVFNDGYQLDPKMGDSLDYRNSANSLPLYVDMGGNLSVDPLVVALTENNDSSDEDLHLQSTSPCIDAGNPAYSDPDGSRSDMGAYGGPYATW
jgi:hypothetical protein